MSDAIDPAVPPEGASESAADLGLFEPPEGYEFESEFQEDPPRPVPGVVRFGRYVAGQRAAFRGWVTFGLVCLTLAPLPFVQRLGWTILPLGYLTWIGLAGLAIAVIVGLRAKLAPGPRRYIVEGIPIVVRIRALAQVVTDTYNEQPTLFAYVAVVDVRDPETGEVRQVQTVSPKLSDGQRKVHQLTYRVGDYATGVLLPGQPVEEVRLYGFLGLNPDVGLVRDMAKRRGGVLQAIGVGAVMVVFLGGLMWCLYGFGRYHPFEFDYRQALWPALAGSVVLGGGLLGAIYAGGRSERRRRAERNEQAAAEGGPVEIGTAKSKAGGVLGVLVLVAGALVLGAAVTLAACFSTNAILDASPPTLRPVELRELSMVTHNLIYREYVAEWAFPGAAETHELRMSPDEMYWLANRPVGVEGVAVVRGGRFGWPWIQTIVPADLFEPAGDGAEEAGGLR